MNESIQHQTDQAPVKTVVWVTAEFEALHRWKDAPAIVSFLRNLHRHIFKVVLRVNVKHYDRDVEMLQLKWELQEQCKVLVEMLQTNLGFSCEMMAATLHRQLCAKYSIASVEVSEDGENGATLYYK